MAPYEIKDQTASLLWRIKLSLVNPEFKMYAENLPEEQKHGLILLRSKVNTAHNRMRNSELAAIRDQLAALEPELTAGASQVEGVLADLQKTEEILRVVNGFLGVVGRIITLV